MPPAAFFMNGNRVLLCMEICKKLRYNFDVRNGWKTGIWRQEKMFIREYQSSDCKELTELFYDTVHTVNAKDYTKEQLDAWATGQVDLEKWNQSLQEHFSVVVVDAGIIVGFGDIDKKGYLDRLFVHSGYQRKGIAATICNRLESAVQEDIVTHASITARPFFEKRGYKVVKEQQVERQGIFLTNFVMIKEQLIPVDRDG